MKQENNFDGIRLAAALAVLVGHQFALAGRVEPQVVGHYTLSTMGVVVFFSVSGFLVTQSWARDPDAGRFARRRALRIWPALAVNVVILAAAVAFIRPGMAWDAAKFAILNAMFVRRDGAFFVGTPYPQLNGPLWTISIEVFCYVVIAALGMFLGAKRLPWALGLALGVFILMLAPLSESTVAAWAIGSGDPTFVPWFCALFAAGSLCALVPTLQRRWLLALILGSACIGAGHVTLGLLVAVPLAIIQIGIRSWPLLRHAARAGDLSYGIYLWAWPVQQSIVWLMGTTAPLWLLLATSLVATIALASLSWRLVEKVALEKKPSSARGGADALNKGQPQT